jgi:hypothetical protein
MYGRSAGGWEQNKAQIRTISSNPIKAMTLIDVASVEGRWLGAASAVRTETYTGEPTYLIEENQNSSFSPRDISHFTRKDSTKSNLAEDAHSQHVNSED